MSHYGQHYLTQRMFVLNVRSGNVGEDARRPEVAEKMNFDVHAIVYTEVIAD